MSPAGRATSKRILFFGSPPIAVESLQALIGSRHEVVGVVTGPDRPAGRGMELKSSAVKQAALEAGLPVLQPRTLRETEAQAQLARMQADVFAVVAYGLILPVAVLEIPALGCVNAHFSLLPRHRGAAPVERAIIEGDTKTGVAIMRMDPGLDTGPVYRMIEEPIGPDDSSGQLAERLAAIGARALVEVVDDLEQLEAEEQSDEGATYAAKLTSQDARIDWSRAAARIHNQIRGLNPRPGAWTELEGRRMKVLRSRLAPGPVPGEPGTLQWQGAELLVATGEGALELLEVQPEGRARMAGRDFARGKKKLDGRKLG